MGDGEYYFAQESDCISSIAFQRGFFWETIWKCAENEPLRRHRNDPNVIYEGDRVFIPARRLKEEPRSTEQRYRFRLKGVPAVARFRFFKEDKPRANATCVLEIDGRQVLSTTDGDGCLETPIPPDARQGRITFKEGDTEETYILSLGQMDPVAEPSGAKKRLRNLGYECGDGEEGLESALKEYQLNRGLEVTGELDEATQETLLKDHGC